MSHTFLLFLCFIQAIFTDAHKEECFGVSCIRCHHCNHMTCVPPSKLTCYSIAKGSKNDGTHHHDNDCRCQPQDYCDSFLTCDNWLCQNSNEKAFCIGHQCVCRSIDFCPSHTDKSCMHLNCSVGLTPICNTSNYCQCTPLTDTCSGNNVQTCHDKCHQYEKLVCDHGQCMCKPFNYCNQLDTDCVDFSCNIDVGEIAFCNGSQCQCHLVTDRCRGNDVNSCQHLNCSQYHVKVCRNGICKCQLNPSCLSDSDCMENNTVMELGEMIYLRCRPVNNLYPECHDERCQCNFQFQTTGATKTVAMGTTAVNQYTETSEASKSSHHSSPPTTLRTTKHLITTRNMSWTTKQALTTGKEVSLTTSQTLTTRKVTLTTNQTSNTETASPTTNRTTNTGTLSSTNHTVTTGTVPSTTNQILTTATMLSTTKQTSTTGCVSRSECNNSNTFIQLPFLTMPCPPGHEDCVNNSCFCHPEKLTTPLPTTYAPRSCHQCGDAMANIPCDLRTVYLGNLQECGSGTYCMTDVVQKADGSVAIYKRCVDEPTCRKEWLAQTSDQDRCLKYAEGALPGQYTCHYCCISDGCNSKIVPDSKYFYSTSSSNIN